MKNSYPFRVIFTLLLLFISSQVALSQFKVVGYMPSWSGSSSAIQYTKLTHINYAFLLPNASGGFAPIENPSKLQDIVSRGHAAGVKVFIAVGGWNNGDDSGFETFSASASGRSTFVNNIVNFINQYNLDGVDIDWEYPDAGASANNYAALMSDLATAMHSRGKGLSAAVVGSGSTGNGVLASVFNSVDHLNLMAYDYNNFDHSTYNNAVESINYWKGRGCPASKCILGVPFYGRPSWSSFATLVSQGADPNADIFNGNGYNGIVTIKKKTQLAKDQAGGIMMWELSQDATGANSLLSAINSVAGSTNPPPPPPQGPYGGTARNIPGKIEAEHYDVGGQDVAYNDASATNEGGAFRTDGVDIEATTDAGAGYNVGWVAAGEWMEYTVNVTSAGTYNFELRVAATAAGKSLHVEFDGQNVTGSIAVPNTGGWQTWQTVTVTNKSLSAGQKIMRVFFDTDAINLNFVNVVSAGSTNTPPTVSITSPTNGSTFTAGNNVSIAANASDANGTVSKVEFFIDGSKISEDASSPYTATYSNAVAGTHSLTAVATDNAGATTTSAAVSITVNGTTTNTPPTVSITSPANGATANAGTSVSITATASDANGSVTKVEFFVDGAKVSEDATSPYTATYANAVAGTHSLTARATDNAGATTTSAAVSITINSTNTGGCSGVAQYVENGGYVAGSKVQNAGGLYQCKPWPYSGWCNGAAWAYGPGTGAYWSDAWDKIGTCGARTATTSTNATKAIEVIPNPTDNTSSVKLNIEDASNAEVVVINQVGVEVFRSKLSSNLEGTIDLTGMKPGIYVVKISANGNVWYEKLLKQ